MQISSYGSYGSMLSLQDMKQMREQMFSKSDANGNGGLDIGEFKAMGKNLPAGRSDQANGDKAAEVFAKIDADGDGQITQSEMEAAKPEPKGPPPGMLLQIQEDAGSSSSSSLADLLAANSNDDSSTTTDTSGNSGTGLDNVLAAMLQKLQAAYSSLQTTAVNGSSISSVA